MLTKEQQQLVEENHNLIYFYLQRHHLSIEEYYDLAAIGLCRAAETFDPNVAVFSTYAMKCIHNAVGMELRKYHFDKYVPDDACVSLNQETYQEDGSLTLEGLLADDIDIEDDLTTLLSFAMFWDKLRDKDKEMLRVLNEEGTQEKAAEKLGYSQAHLSRWVRSLKDRFKRFIEIGGKK